MIIAQIPFRLQALYLKTRHLRASFVPFVLLVLSAVFLRVSAVKILSRLPAKPVSSTQSVVEPACLPPRVSHIPRFMPQLDSLKSAPITENQRLKKFFEIRRGVTLDGTGVLLR